MARTQKNKATNNHLGLLKAKVAKLKRELIEGSKVSSTAYSSFTSIPKPCLNIHSP